MTPDTVGDEIVVRFDPDGGLWRAWSALYANAHNGGGIHTQNADALGALAEYLAAERGDIDDLRGLPRAARLQRAASLLNAAATALLADADEILDRAEAEGTTEEGGYRLRVRESTRRTRTLDVGAFADAHPAEFHALATVPLGAVDKILGRTEVDRFCSVEEQTTRKQTVEKIVGGGA